MFIIKKYKVVKGEVVDVCASENLRQSRVQSAKTMAKPRMTDQNSLGDTKSGSKLRDQFILPGMTSGKIYLANILHAIFVLRQIQHRRLEPIKMSNRMRVGMQTYA